MLSHTSKHEVAFEKARIKSMSHELERLLKLREICATRITSFNYCRPTQWIQRNGAHVALE